GTLADCVRRKFLSTRRRVVLFNTVAVRRNVGLPSCCGISRPISYLFHSLLTIGLGFTGDWHVPATASTIWTLRPDSLDFLMASPMVLARVSVRPGLHRGQRSDSTRHSRRVAAGVSSQPCGPRWPPRYSICSALLASCSRGLRSSESAGLIEKSATNLVSSSLSLQLVQLKGGEAGESADGCANLPGLCLVINNETVQIRTISVKISGRELKRVVKQAEVEVNVTDSGDGDSHSAEQQLSAIRKLRRRLHKIIKRKKVRPSADSSDKKAAGAQPAAGRTVSGWSADGSAGGGKLTTSNRQLHPPWSAGFQDGESGKRNCTGQDALGTARGDSEMRSAAAVEIGLDPPDGGDGSRRSSSSDSEVSVPTHDEGKARAAAEIAAAAASPPRAAASALEANTVTGETVRRGDCWTTRRTSQREEPKPPIKKPLSFLNRKKDKSKGSTDQLLSTSNFPHDVPEKIMPSTVSSPQSTPQMLLIHPAVKKQKALIIENGKNKRYTVDGKSRSVWLDPPAGEKVEIWKEYFGDDGECNRALGRLPGTDKYGYILRDEIDPEGEFLRPRERKKHIKKCWKSWSCFQYIYGNEDDEQYM
uniref:MBD domain-containing protein n=1 Tax=Macrostomum lignano TaxID=282301 RepID=A0A1I8F8L1_9PLAT